MQTAVIMPTLNSETYLVEALKSVLNQSHRDFNLLILDGGSVDATLDICWLFQKRDPRIEIIQLPDTTPTARINKIIFETNFDFYLMAHSDDLSYPNRLEAQLYLMTSDPSLIMSGTWVHYWLHEKSYFHEIPHHWGILSYPLEHEDIKARLPFWWCFSIPSLIVNGRKMRETGLCFDGTFDVASDWLFYWEAAKKGKVANMQKPLISYRSHLSSHGPMSRNRIASEARLIRQQMAREIGLEDFLRAQEFKLFLDLVVEYDQVRAPDLPGEIQALFEKLREFEPARISPEHWLSTVNIMVKRTLDVSKKRRGKLRWTHLSRFEKMEANVSLGTVSFAYC